MALDKLRNKRKLLDAAKRNDAVVDEDKIEEKKRKRVKEKDVEAEENEDKVTDVTDYLRDPKTRDLLDSSDSLDEIALNMMNSYAPNVSTASVTSIATSNALDSDSKSNKTSNSIKLDYDHDLKYVES